MSGLLYSLIIGALAGWLAGKIMKGGGFGILINIYNTMHWSEN